MATLKKYNIKSEAIGTVDVDEDFANSEVNSQLVKDYIVALRANLRQWSANTKGRSEVSHSTKKPHPQKGTGRARQGSLAAPQYKGGGRVFGPKPKFDQHVRINKKEKLAAIKALIAEKIRANRVIVLETTEMDEPKTKTVASFIDTLGLGSRTLFLGEGNYVQVQVGDYEHRVSIPCENHRNFTLSVRNIPRAEFRLVTNINGYDLLLAQNIVITQPALAELNQWLNK